MGLCKGLGAIYSGSCRESALLIVRAKGEWKMCLPLLPRRWGRASSAGDTRGWYWPPLKLPNKGYCYLDNS